jgi:hypothetical protein
MQLTKTPLLFTDIYRVNSNVIPKLFAYQLKLRGSDEQTKAGRRVADRLSRAFKAHWIWSETFIVTDNPQAKEKIEEIIRAIRTKEKDDFRELVGLNSVEQWQPTSQVKADFTAQALISDLHFKIQALLPEPFDLDGLATVEREYSVRGWVVQNTPAIAISVDSSVIFNEDLKTYFDRVGDEDLIRGLYVADKVPFENGSVMKGEVFDVVGYLDKTVSRDDLLDIVKRDGSRKYIEAADRGELVVKVGNNGYQYVSSELKIVVLNKFYKRFGINTQDAQNATWIIPAERHRLVRELADFIQSQSLIGEPLDSTPKESGFFLTPKNYDPRIRFDKGRESKYEGGTKLINDLSNAGFYNRIPSLGTLDSPLEIGIINSSKSDAEPLREALEEILKKFQFMRLKTQIVQTNSVSRVEFEKAILKLQDHAHIILAVIPDSDSQDENDWGPYYDFKSLR